MDLQGFSSGLGATGNEMGQAQVADRAQRMAMASQSMDMLMKNIAAGQEQQKIGIQQQQVTQAGWQNAHPIGVQDSATGKWVMPQYNTFTGETRQLPMAGPPMESPAYKAQAYPQILREIFKKEPGTETEQERDLVMRFVGVNMPWQIAGGQTVTKGAPLQMLPQDALKAGLKPPDGVQINPNAMVEVSKDIHGNLIPGSAQWNVTPTGITPQTAITPQYRQVEGAGMVSIPTATVTQRGPAAAGGPVNPDVKAYNDSLAAGQGGAGGTGGGTATPSAKPSKAAGATSPSVGNIPGTANMPGVNLPGGSRVIAPPPVKLGEQDKRSLEATDRASAMMANVEGPLRSLAAMPGPQSLSMLGRIRADWFLYNHGITSGMSPTDAIKQVKEPQIGSWFIAPMAQLRAVLMQTFISGRPNVKWMDLVGAHIPDPAVDTPTMMLEKFNTVKANLPIYRQAILDVNNPLYMHQQIYGGTGPQGTAPLIPGSPSPVGGAGSPAPATPSSKYDVSAAQVLDFASSHGIGYDDAARLLEQASGPGKHAEPNPHQAQAKSIISKSKLASKAANTHPVTGAPLQ